MGDVEFRSVFKDIMHKLKGTIFSTMYFGNHCGKFIFLVKHQSKTIMIVYKENNLSVEEFNVSVSSRQKVIDGGIKIVGCQNVILLLDEQCQLWRLINAFEFSNEKDECLYSIEEKCYYEWIPFKNFKNEQVLEITALENSFACLVQNKELERRLHIICVNNLFSISCGIKYDILNTTESQSFYLKSLNINFHNSTSEWLLLVTDRKSGRTYTLCEKRESKLINISRIPIVCILSFEERKCLAIFHKNGKVIYIFYDNLLENTNECMAFLDKDLITVEKCDCSASCIIWSDGYYLHHTNMIFQLDNSYSVKLTHLQINPNILGVKSLIKVSNGLMGITFNDFYYHITINRLITPKECIRSPEEILSEIWEGSMKIKKFTEEIDTATDYLTFKEAIQNNIISNKIEVGRENEFITLKSNLKLTFKKDYWQVQLKAINSNRHLVELTDLEYDFSEGMVIKIKTDLLTKNQLDVRLIGNYGPEFDILLAPIRKIDVDKDTTLEKVAKNLYEIAKRRNPYLTESPNSYTSKSSLTNYLSNFHESEN